MTQNHFSALGLPVTFDLDLAVLEKEYFLRQRRYHPDKLMGKSAAERREAIARSMQANEAYQTLQLSLTRAQHLLELQGEKGGTPSQALLTEVLEWREALAEAESLLQIDALEAQNLCAMEDTTGKLSAAFGANNWSQAHELTIRLSYAMKSQEEIRLKKKRMAKKD